MEKEKVLNLYKERKITIRKAASLLGLSYVETYDLIVKEGIDISYSVEDFKKDFGLNIVPLGLTTIS